MSPRLAAALLLVLACATAAVDPVDQDVVDSVNQAINSQMQMEVVNGKREASAAYSDLAPYLGKGKGNQKAELDSWEAKTIADIRGLSQTKMAVPDVSDSELQFAQDAAKAKDIMEQTDMLNSMSVEDAKKEKAAEINAQLSHARETLDSSVSTSDGAGPVDSDVLLEEAEGKGPVDGGIFMDGETAAEYAEQHTIELVEADEGKNFHAELMDGSDEAIEAQINEAINTQVGDKLDKLSHKKTAEMKGMEQFEKDAQEAETAVNDIQAAVAAPLKSSKISAADQKEAAEEGDEDAKQDLALGDAQEEHAEDEERLSASDDISAELMAAQAKLREAQNDA